MRTRKLPPNIDTTDNPLFPPIIDDPLQYVDTSDSLIPFTHLHPSTLAWLWHHLIPIGSLTLLEGPASLGKSTLLLDLAARLSSGLPLPDPSSGLLPDPSSSPTPLDPAPLMLITPDDPSCARSHAFFSASSTRPDLLFSFTNITLSHILSGDRLTRPFHFTSDDLDILAREIETAHPKLVIIDPFTSTLDTDPPLTETKLASLLTRLNTLAATHQFACILVRTTPARPSQGTRLQRSIQPLLKAATAFTLTPDPLSPEHTLLVQTKSTFARPAPILRFHLASHPHHPELPSLVWDGTSDLSHSDLAATSHLPTSTLAPTRQHILRILEQHTTSVAVSTLAEALPQLSYNLLKQTLRRMLNDHQVTSPYHGLYSLPNKPSPLPMIPFEPSTESDRQPAFSPLDVPSSQITTPANYPSPSSPNTVTSVTFDPPVTFPYHPLNAPSSPEPATSHPLPLHSHLPQGPVTFGTPVNSHLSHGPVTFSTLPDHESLLPPAFFHHSPLSPDPVTSVTFDPPVTSPTSFPPNTPPSSPTQFSHPASSSQHPTAASPSPEAVTSTDFPSSYHAYSYLTPAPVPPPSVRPPSTTTRSLSNSCSDLHDLPTPYPVTNSPSQDPITDPFTPESESGTIDTSLYRSGESG